MRRRRRLAGVAFRFGALALLASGLAQSSHADQQLSLRAGWNLVSLSVAPGDSSAAIVLQPLVTAGKLVSIWTYNAQSASWARYPAVPGVPAIVTLEPGKGYWLKVTSQTPLAIVEAQAGVPAAPLALQPGWNLVGFPLDEPTGFEKVLRNVPVDQVWRFKETGGVFEGIQITGGQAALPAFTEIEPGRAYWVRLSGSQPASLTPLLTTALRSDTDLEPLLPDPAPGEEPTWSPFTPGDFDIEGDGKYDRPDTQRKLDFLESIDVQTVGLTNPGAGVLSWRVSVANPIAPSWLKIRTLDPDTGEETLYDSLTGGVTSESDLVEILVDREGLPPGDYQGQLVIESNGGSSLFPTEPSRAIPVAMQVDGLGGDYQVRVKIETVDGTTADLPSPRLFLSLYNDGMTAFASDDNRLKAIIDAKRTLLFPNTVRMVGSVYEDETARFIVSGSFELPVDDPDDPNDGDNPYEVAIRREITLIGDRRIRADPEDALLGPLDLKGDYRETIRGLLGNPIYIRGRFEALRLAEAPSALDGAEIACGAGGIGAIPDNAQKNITLVAPSQLLLTGVDVTVALTHTRASDLRLTLVSPQGQTVLLREALAGNTGELSYDETALPVESLSIYEGTLSQTPTNDSWTLRVEDTLAGETGSISACTLKLAGTRVNDVSGTVAGVGAGAGVLLTGCGVSALTTTSAGGSYSFDNVVDCLYEVTVVENGFQAVSQTVALAGADATGVNLSPGTIFPVPTSNPITPSTDGTHVLSLVSTLSGAGALQPRGRLRYVRDSATYDVDRPPVGAPVGDEDTTEFSSVPWACTKTNRPNFDGAEPPCLPAQVGQARPPLLTDSVIDGPVGTGLHARAYVSLGGPIVGGRSVAGNLRLQVGGHR